MKNTKLFLVMAALMAMVTLFSCDKINPEMVETHTLNQGVGIQKVSPDDEIEGYTYRDARERFVEGGIEYSFIHVDIYKNAGEVPETTRRYWIRPISHVGVEPQYFHISDTTFVTTRGQETVLEVQETTDGSWKAYASSKNQLWDAKNKSGNEFAHATTTTAAHVVYTFNGENNIKGYTVEFDVPEWTLNEKTLPFEEVSGVFYDGKSWDAIKYESEITSTFKIADALVMSGETSTKDLLVSNLAFFLKHVIDSKIEKLAYEGKFYAKNNVVDTETERVVGSLVTRDNGDIVESKDFELGMRLFLSLSQPQDQKVNSEKELMDTGSNHNRGNVTDTPMSSDVFTGKKFAGQDSITLSDGVVVNAPFGWECWSWGAEQLPYAEIVDRQVSIKSVKNEQLSNNSTLVNTVTVTMSGKLGFVGINRAAETYEVSVSYNRIYNLPDDYSTEFEQTDYVLSLQNENASKLSTKDQHNTIRTVVKNRGEVSSTSEAVYPLSLYASVAGGDTVKVDKPFKPSVISIEDHADKGEWKNAKDANGFDVRWVKDSQTIRIKGGNVMEYEWYHEIQGRNNKDIYDHAEVKGVSSSDISFSEPVLVDSTKTDNAITKVYRVDAQFTPTVTSTASVQTKAGNTNVNSLAVATSFYQMVVEGDKYIDGQDEVEWYTRTNGNVIEVGGRLYEHYTISGKVLVDEQQTTMEPTLKGVDAEDVIVDNADGYSLTGNGLNKTGNGNYNNYLTKGSSSYPYTFNYNAPASATVKLNGRSGKGASKTFNASFVIKDGSLTSGASSQSNGYTVYPKTSNVKGTYTVEDKTVELTAQATRNLKVKIPTDDFVSDRIVKTVTKNGNSINYNVKLYETWSLSGEKLKDEKSGTLTPSLTGSNGGDIVVNNVNFTTSGNGYNGTGSGTYTDNASNGENSFSNSYSWSAPSSVTVTLNGTNGTKTETISTAWTIAEAGQKIGTATANGGYNVYPYTNTVKGTYTVEDKTVELTANATKNLKVEIPQDTFVSDRIVKTVTKNGNSVNYNVKLYETWSLSGEKLKDEKSGTLTPSLTGSNGGDIVVKNVNFTTSGNGHNGTGNGTYTDNASNGESSFSNSYSWSAPASVTVNLNGTKGTKTETISTTWTIAEAGQNIGTATANGDYNVYPYTNTVKGTYTVENQTVELTANATKNLKVENPKDEFVSDRIVKTVTKNGNSVNYNVKLYETWSLSGEKLKDEKSGTLTPSLTGSNGGDIVVKNVNFTTSGNGHNGTGNGTYTDNASNGESSFSNSYSWSAPASVTVNLNGTKGTKTETISTTWTIAEAGQNIGTKVAETGYDVYPYTNTVKGTYTADNQTVELTANATKSLKVAREIPKIIPDEWGKIKSAGFSAVPSHLDANGNYVDGSNAQTATSCMTIVTDKGAVPVLFGWADQDPRVPTTAQILASPFTTGSYTSDYNSGYYGNTGWVPAIAKDTNTGISYSIPGVPDIRFVRNESLVMWGWRGGNYSTVLPGYTCKVEDGVLTVTYNGQVVLELR